MNRKSNSKLYPNSSPPNELNIITQPQVDVTLSPTTSTPTATSIGTMNLLLKEELQIQIKAVVYMCNNISLTLDKTTKSFNEQKIKMMLRSRP